MGRAQRYGNTFDWTTAVPNVALPDQLPGASRALSCENCRKRKMKCSRTYPCSSCDMRKEVCTWKNGMVPAPAPTSTGDHELDAAHTEVRRLRKLVDMLMGRLQEVQDDHGRLVESFGLPPLPQANFPPNQHRSHQSHNHNHKHNHNHTSPRHHPYPLPFPSPSPVLGFGGNSFFPPPPPSSSSGASSIFEYRSSRSRTGTDDSMSSYNPSEREPLFPGFPSGLPFAPAGVGSGNSHACVNPRAMSGTGAQPGDIVVEEMGDGMEYLKF